MHGLSRIGSYVHQPDHQGEYGEIWEWGEGGTAPLQLNRWYAIEQYVKLNTPGKHDGVLMAWIDGRLVLHRYGIRFRDTTDLKIEKLWMNVYHGGTRPPGKDLSCMSTTSSWPASTSVRTGMAASRRPDCPLDQHFLRRRVAQKGRWAGARAIRARLEDCHQVTGLRGGQCHAVGNEVERRYNSGPTTVEISVGCSAAMRLAMATG